MPPDADGLLEEYQRRTRQLEALYETAGDLTALRDVDKVLEAIVRRGRQLLASDVAYLMLLDDDRQQIYMRVGEGIQTQQFLDIRLGFGEGVAGLVASSGLPLWTSDYARDERLAARVDDAVREESLVAIVGVPLSAGGRSLGVLLASDRRPREFTHDDVALLSSLAHHAAIALENASLFQEAQDAVARWKEASGRVERQNEALRRAATMHEQLTRLVLEGAPLADLADAVAATVGGDVAVLDARGASLTPVTDMGPIATDDLEQAAAAEGLVRDPRSVGSWLRVVVVQAASRRLGYLVHRGELESEAELRALERAAIVTALLLLDRRAHDDARARVVSRVLTELVSHDRPDFAGVQRRARAAGVAVPEAPYVIAVALAPGGGDREVDLEPAVALAVREGWLARIDGGTATMVVPGSDASAVAAMLAESLADVAGAPVTVGAVGPVSRLSGLKRHVDRALTCAKVLEATGRSGRGAAAEDLGVYALLFGDLGRERIEEFVAETIGRVQQWDTDGAGHLMATLEAYFEHGGQTGRVTEALFVHVNTLYQRLERLDQLLGHEWRRGEQALQVHLAVRLAGLLAHDM